MCSLSCNTISLDGTNLAVDACVTFVVYKILTATVFSLYSKLLISVLC